MDAVNELMVSLTTELGEFKQEILDEFKKINSKRDLDLLSTNNQLHLDKEQLELEIAKIKALNNEISLNNTELQLSNNELELDNTRLQKENKQLMINYNTYINEPSQSSINILERFL